MNDLVYISVDKSMRRDRKSISPVLINNFSQVLSVWLFFVLLCFFFSPDKVENCLGHLCLIRLRTVLVISI